MVELKAFLKHLESDRVLFEELQGNQKVWVRTAEENEKGRENSCMSVEDALSLMAKCEATRNRLKEIRTAFYQGLYSEYEKIRQKTKEQWDGIYKNRENERENLNHNSEIERALIEAMMNEETTEEAMRKAFDDAKDTIDKPLWKIANKCLTNVIIRTLSAKLTGA